MKVSATFRTLVLFLVEPHVLREKLVPQGAVLQGADSQSGRTPTDEKVTLEIRSARFIDANRRIAQVETRGLTFS
jgi:hypothetical protein